MRVCATCIVRWGWGGGETPPAEGTEDIKSLYAQLQVHTYWKDVSVCTLCVCMFNTCECMYVRCVLIMVYAWNCICCSVCRWFLLLCLIVYACMCVGHGATSEHTDLLRAASRQTRRVPSSVLFLLCTTGRSKFLWTAARRGNEGGAGA